MDSQEILRMPVLVTFWHAACKSEPPNSHKSSNFTEHEDQERYP